LLLIGKCYIFICEICDKGVLDLAGYI
jgi:hypothetical protein